MFLYVCMCIYVHICVFDYVCMHVHVCMHTGVRVEVHAVIRMLINDHTYIMSIINYILVLFVEI